MTNHPKRDLNALAGVPSKQRGMEEKSSSRRSEAQAEKSSFPFTRAIRSTRSVSC
jgi:hypothetical protein